MKKILILAFIALCQSVMAQSINLDKPTRVGNLIVFPDVQDDKMYYYMPDKARLAIGPDGNPQFSFLRYVENKRAEDITREGDGGGIVHAVVSLEVPAEDIRIAERNLKRIKADAIIKGPIVYKACRFSIVSSFKEENGDFTKKVVGLGTGPVLDGGKAAISMRLTKLGSKILWESFKTAAPDISFSFEVELEGYRQPKRAIIEADFEQIYNNSHFSAGVAMSYLQAEIDMAFEELTRSGAIKVEQFGSDAGMETLMNTAYNKLTDMMFEPSGGTGTPNIGDLTGMGASQPSMLDRASGMLARNQQREQQNNNNSNNNNSNNGTSNTTNNGTNTSANTASSSNGSGGRSSSTGARPNTPAPVTTSTSSNPTTGGNSGASTTAAPTSGSTTGSSPASTTGSSSSALTEGASSGTSTTTGNGASTTGSTPNPTASAPTGSTASTSAVATPTESTTNPTTSSGSGNPTPTTAATTAGGSSPNGNTPSPNPNGTANQPGTNTGNNNGNNQPAANTGNNNGNNQPSENNSNSNSSVGSSFSVAVSYQMKQRKQKGKFKIDLNKWTTDVLTNRFDQNIGNLTSLMNNPKFFREVNLDDPLFKQRELIVMLDGTNARDFGEFVNFATVRMRKNHEGGAITDDEVTINRVNFNQEGNSFKMLYGWKGDNDRDKWMNYEYEVLWSLYGDQTVKIPVAKSSFGAINLKAPLIRKSIEAQADPEILKNSGVRLITVNLFYKVGDKEFTKQMTLNPSKNILSQRADIFVPTEAVSYEYEVSWRLTGNKIVNLPRQSSGETILFVDEIPNN
jgi:hypothetical protein